MESHHEKSLTLAQVAALLGVEPPADALRVVSGIATLEEAGPDQLSFLGSDRYLKPFAATRAAAVIVHKRVRLPDVAATPVFVVDDADLAVARILEHFAPTVVHPKGIDATAKIDATASVGDNVAIAANVVVGRRCHIGQNTILHPGVVIGDDVSIGDDCILFPNVVVRERITIGHRVIINASAVLGSDGFGYRWDGKRHAKIPQIGTVIVEDDVEIGSCTCIDRAKFSATRIGTGSKIDNLVQIGHNVQVGPHCIIVGQAGLAGSVTLGAGVVLGGQSAVRDHIHMGDGAMLAACSGVMEDVEPKQIVSGLPALPHRQSLREQGALRRLPDLVTQVRKLQETVNALQAKIDAG